MIGFILNTLGIPIENAFQGNYRQRLEKLMKVNNLRSFIYSNVCPKNPDGGSANMLPVRVVGHIRGNELLIRQAVGDEPQRLTGIGFLNKSPYYLAVQNTEDNWAIYDKHIDEIYVQNCQSWAEFDAETLPNAIYKQIYDEFVEAGFSMNPPKDKEDPNKLFTELTNAVQRQINEIIIEKLRKYADPKTLEWFEKLKFVKAAMPKLSNGALVLFDDNFDTQFTGKGKLAIPYLLSEGWTQVSAMDD